jgi:hypothetical protein
MSNLVPYSPGQNGRQPTRIERRTSRALEQARGDQAIATTEKIGEIEMIADVTETALLAVSHVSALESMLVNRTPHAEERLRHIADAGALGMTNVVFAASRRR